MVMKDEIVYFQSGAGIVYDSDPTKEYEETVNKAKAINAAINLAENGLVWKWKLETWNLEEKLY